MKRSRKKRKSRKGFFITFEGIEGSGKSTHIKYLSRFLKRKGLKVLLTKEPGGTPVGEKIRKILLDPLNKGLSPKAEVFLFLASRAQHVSEKIQPFLNKGYIIISDRFHDASVAYQGDARDIGIDMVQRLNQMAINDTVPDVTILMDVDLKKGLTLAKKNNIYKNGDRIERESMLFHKKVQREYYKIHKREPGRVYLVKIDRDLNITQSRIRDIIIHKLRRKGFII
ncbi:MAG: dTMP kinase [Spirochaetes bacterium]|nr:dTMP kinase [Spirochaetota bacterium]